jgi:phage tail sheath protein FI
VTALALDLTQGEAAQLSALALNCLRTFPTIGPVVWGDRTMAGAEGSTDQFKYVPVRRMAIFLEQSILAGIQWAVFEPNDPALWSQVSDTIGAFLKQLFAQGAFAGTTPAQSYFVRCDNTTVTQADINAGVLNIVVGFAPMQPAEFVIFSIQLLVQP